LITVLAAAAISTPAVVAPAIFSPAAAQGELSISIGVPPPAPIYEVVPAPRAGYIWSPGAWRWEGGRHIWHGGYWVAERPGHRWVPDRWEAYNGGWRHNAGHWDSDHDGVPDRYDRHPNNPYRR